MLQLRNTITSAGIASRNSCQGFELGIKKYIVTNSDKTNIAITSCRYLRFLKTQISTIYVRIATGKVPIKIFQQIISKSHRITKAVSAAVHTPITLIAIIISAL